MPAYKDKERGTWYASFYYTDWRGDRKLKKKRGFPRKKDAEEYEREFLRKEAQSCDMTFDSMTKLYMDDMRPRLRESTMRSKEYLIEGKILPFFGSLPLNAITPAHVRKWQAEILKENPAPTYAKSIHNQLSAIFNYAVKYYRLPENPARVAGAVGKKKASEMKFWTVEEFNKFLPCVPRLPARVGFSVMFWTGLRIGELLALTPADIDLDAKTLSVTKTFQNIDGREVVTEPKTPKSRRTILPAPGKSGTGGRRRRQKEGKRNEVLDGGGVQQVPAVCSAPSGPSWLFGDVLDGAADRGASGAHAGRHRPRREDAVRHQDLSEHRRPRGRD